MRRIFWLAIGLGAGVTGAILTARFARKQMERVSPSHLAQQARGGLLEFSKLVSESMAEGKRAMREKEEELRGNPPVD